ncbi:MAG TPA: molybdopterin-dependent oxidoreductase [Bacteroidales bacterium]|nr:molybdopterin-dependent oxidoreductase [Bacteroidales bacterium]
MIRQIVIVTVTLLLLLLACRPENSDNSQADAPDGTGLATMKTPAGDRLLPAAEGPVRSAFGVPQVDLNTYRLEIRGLVDSPYSLTWNDIKVMTKSETGTMLMYCVEGWEVFGKWEGLPVKDLLAMAGVKQDGKYVLFRCADGYSTSLPVVYIEKYNTLLASAVNGEPLQPKNGFPLRLVAFGKYGYKWAKWVTSIEVTSQSVPGFWESTGYTDEANVPLARRRYYEGSGAEPLSY